MRPRREQQGRPHLPVAVGPCPADRGVRPADERGASRRTRSTTTTSSSPAICGAHWRRSATEHLQGADAAGGALCRALPGAQRAGPGDRCADRGARPARAASCASAPATMRPPRSASSARPSGGSTSTPRSPADRQGAGRRAVAGRRRRGAVDRRGRPVPALAHRQSDGCAPAHQRQPAALSAAARWPQHEEQAAAAAAVAHRARRSARPQIPHGADAAARYGGGRRAAARVAGRAARRDHRTASTTSRRPTGRR